MSIDEITFPDARRTLTRDVIVSALDPSPVRSWWRRTPTVIAIAVGAIAIPVGVATAYYGFREVEDTSTLRCFTEASLDGDAIYLSRAAPEGAGGGVVQIDDPVAACADLWSQGVLRAGVEDAQPPTPGANLPVPRLAACVIDYYDDVAVVAVVPGDETVCQQLGLPRWAG